jgi:hypothetical protein
MVPRPLKFNSIPLAWLIKIKFEKITCDNKQKELKLGSIGYKNIFANLYKAAENKDGSTYKQGKAG